MAMPGFQANYNMQAGRWGKRLTLLALACGASLSLTACFPLFVAGVGTGVSVVSDRRTTANVLADQQIDARISSRVGNKFGDKVHLNVNSYNRVALLTGEAPDEATKAEVERIARAAEDVRNVFNEMTVSLPSTFGARTNDTGLTTKIKARLVEANRVSPLYIKVTTERSVVFLMGMVNKQEAADAVDTVSHTNGVERVVTLFEYVQ